MLAGSIGFAIAILAATFIGHAWQFFGITEVAFGIALGGLSLIGVLCGASLRVAMTLNTPDRTALVTKSILGVRLSGATMGADVRLLRSETILIRPRTASWVGFSLVCVDDERVLFVLCMDKRSEALLTYWERMPLPLQAMGVEDGDRTLVSKY